MATIINTPQSDSNNGVAFLIGVILLIIGIVIIFYGLPYLMTSMNRGYSLQINVPSDINVHVK